jgi:hypothetical protein
MVDEFGKGVQQLSYKGPKMNFTDYQIKSRVTAKFPAVFRLSNQTFRRANKILQGVNQNFPLAK